jgi:hypothetical protein
MQPRAFLDGMFYKNIEKHLTDRMISEDENIFNSIDDDLILKWCDENPINRYPHIAANIKPYKIESGSNKPVWTSLAKKILTNSSNSLDVLNAFKSRFYPSSWGGSLADILQKGLELIVELKNHNDPFISEWATKEEILFNDEIAQRKEWEIESYNARDESFE